MEIPVKLKVNFKIACRICMEEKEDNEVLFEIEFQENKLHDILQTLVPIQISIDDNLPNKICGKCKSNTIIAYKNYQQCLSSDKTLRLMLEESLRAEQSTEELVQEQLKEEEEHLLDEYSYNSDNIEEKFNIENDLVSTDNDNELPQSDPGVNMTILKSECEAIDDPEPRITKQEHPDQFTSKGKLKKNKCEICGKAFEKPSKLVRHMNVHNSNRRPFPCKSCDQSFANENSLIRHEVIHSDLVQTISTQNKEFICIVCKREFQSQEAVSSHLKTHKEELDKLEFSCDLCPKTFKKINQLTRHSKTHAENKTFKCNICSRMFAKGSHLIDHLNRHKGIKPHVCTICSKSFQQSCTLKDHMRIHSDEKPFLCSECGKSFNNASNLRQHVKRHLGVKMFSCNLCPSKFSCKGGLTSHMSTHTGLKPHVCDTCGTSFTKPYSLTKHKRLHTGERPYVCEVCGMRFNSSDHVKRHMRTHTGERPYKCTYCERAYAQSNDLVKHLRTHVGENTYKCEILLNGVKCGEAFRLQSQLREHWRTHYEKSGDTQQMLDISEQTETIKSDNTIEKIEIELSEDS